MKKILVHLNTVKTIPMGYVGENQVTTVVFDISPWIATYGSGQATVLFSPDGVQPPYPCLVEIQDTCANWLLTSSELQSSGKGKCQLVYHSGGKIIAKSPVFPTDVRVSLSEDTTDPPEAYTSWVDQVLAAGASTGQAADRAEKAVRQVDEMVQSARQQMEHIVSQTVEIVEQVAADKLEEIEKLTAIIPPVTPEDNGKILTAVDGKWTAVYPEYSVESWADIQRIVRVGLAPHYFPIGYEFTTYDSTENTEIIWVVRGYDTIRPADETLSHSMILETRCVYSNASGTQIRMQFDAPEALYYAENGLDAGKYSFTLPVGYDTQNGGGESYTFTLTQPVPACGVIVFPWEDNQQAAMTKVSSYATLEDTSPIETVGVILGADGINLGTADGNTANMNYMQRIRHGSNHYAQSAIRQWLNSKECAGNVWKAQTKFDRPPSWTNTSPGFMAGLPEDFLQAIQVASVSCTTNSVFEVNSLDNTVFTVNQVYTLKDKFFLLSSLEIFGSGESFEYKDGEQLSFYKGTTEAERIKYDTLGTPRYCWLRSPYGSITDHMREVYASGQAGNDIVSNQNAVAPACIIA